jgi:alpha-mannosidase
MAQLNKLEELAKAYLKKGLANAGAPGYWGSRCVLELQYAAKLSESEGGAHDGLVAKAVDLARDACRAEGAITKEATLTVEKSLQPIAAKAKGYSLICIGHAHIDMNWMWRYDETVSITLDTFRTMLDMMDEYPAFTFGQSQASVYRIVEQYCPEMLEEIKKRVREGRWEVTASTWVEADRNMPNLESMARHFLYTKQYLSKLLDIDPASLDIDYEPDTFGHHVNVPEVLCDAGVKYYYHCRGHEGRALYNWKAPSGRSILVYLESPTWYNWTMDGSCAMVVPDFCKKSGLSSALRVYGVGDHGGGPTRRDIERILDMNAWPIFPAFKFGTYGEFYRLAAKNRSAYPTVEGELNFIFDGCYTTQSRQKKGNREGEAMLAEAEAASALANLAAGAKYDGNAFAEAWKKVLFNQFHDILPGSGTVDTREYAMGQYQEAFAAANTGRTLALRAISAASDTSAFASGEDAKTTMSEGAGVGYGIDGGGVAQVGRHAGIHRLFTVYNPLPFAREELVKITVWDWDGDPKRMIWTGADGKTLPHQLVTDGFNNYWGHRYAEALVRLKAPAMGYTTVALDEDADYKIIVANDDPRVEKPASFVLDNGLIRAEMDPRDGGIVSFVDKKTGMEYSRPGRPMGVFRLVEEDPSRGMSAWTVGRYTNVHALNRGVRFKDIATSPDAVRQSISYEKEFGNGSKLCVTVSLDAGESMLRFDAAVRWQEIGSPETFYPQLNFLMPVAYDYSAMRYDVPMGTIDRPALPHDVPAQSCGMPVNAHGASLMLVSSGKYGYRGTSEGLSLTLLRSSADPDPWPEVGEHVMRMAIALGGKSKAEDAAAAQAFSRGLLVAAARAHKGALPAEQSLFELKGEGLALSAVKLAEDGSGIIVRYCELEGRDGRGELRFFKAPKSAAPVNVLEQPVEGFTEVAGNAARFGYRAYGVGGLLVRFR